MPATTIPALAIIGGGNMATAIINGLRSLPKPPPITVAEPDAGKRERFAADGIATTADNRAAVAGADLLVLAIKPQAIAAVLPDLAAAWSDRKLLITILAGTPTLKIERGLSSGVPQPRVVRAMPNTPMAIGLGMVGLCRGAHATIDDLAMAERVFATCGKVLKVAEERMDAITAVSGSGPAYFFRFAEALVTSAMALGFTREEAVLLVGTTGAGSWEYLLRSGFDAAKLREQVTSPGGTTAAALNTINAAGFDDLWTRALRAAEQRGRELGNA